jgi:regulator of replication initiation timing
MNDKDKEAFNEWRNSTSTRLDIHDAWQAACEYKQKEIEEVELREIKVNRSFVELASKYCELQAENKEWKEAARSEAEEVNRLQAENKRMREALELTIRTAEYVYQPNKPLEKGLPPFYYHTLTYEGDLELIEKTIAARKLLDSTKE